MDTSYDKESICSEKEEELYSSTQTLQDKPSETQTTVYMSNKQSELQTTVYMSMDTNNNQNK
jgi:hypothetical protein